MKHSCVPLAVLHSLLSQHLLAPEALRNVLDTLGDSSANVSCSGGVVHAEFLDAEHFVNLYREESMKSLDYDYLLARYQEMKN